MFSTGLVGKAVRNSKKAISVISYKLLSTIGYDKFRRFVILSRSRTDSTMLISLLNSYSNAYAEEEIFARLNGKRYGYILA